MSTIKEKAIRMILDMSEEEAFDLITVFENFNSKKSEISDIAADLLDDVSGKTTRGRLSRYANPGHQEEEKMSFEVEMLNKHVNLD